MKIIKKTELQIDWNQIKGLIKDRAFTPGDEIEIDGCLWRVLDVEDNGILIWKHTGIEEFSVFNRNGSNEYEGSDLQKFLQGEYKDKLPAEMQELMAEGGPFALSMEEIGKYLPTEGERIAVDNYGDTISYWTRSAYRGSGGSAWNVYSAGFANYSIAAFASRCAPACKLLIS